MVTRFSRILPLLILGLALSCSKTSPSGSRPEPGEPAPQQVSLGALTGAQSPAAVKAPEPSNPIPQTTVCPDEGPWTSVYATTFADWEGAKPAGWGGSTEAATMARATEGRGDAAAVELKRASPNWACVARFTQPDDIYHPGKCYRVSFFTKGGAEGEVAVRFSYKQGEKLFELDQPGKGGTEWTPVQFTFRIPEDADLQNSQLRIYRKPLSQDMVLVDDVTIEEAS